MLPIVAFDVDLHKIYAIDSNGVVLFNKAATIGTFVWGGTVLAEIASPVSFSRGGKASGVMFNLGKWAIHNVAIITRLARDCPGLLVAPSNVWTMGYKEPERHALAKVTARNHDLKECQAMIWSYSVKPTLWKPFDKYLNEL